MTLLPSGGQTDKTIKGRTSKFSLLIRRDSADQNKEYEFTEHWDKRNLYCQTVIGIREETKLNLLPLIAKR